MGIYYEGGFQAVQEYFQTKSCRFCNNPFASDGIKLLRQEPGILVVHIACLRCGNPLGVAIVGTGPKQTYQHNKYFADWSKHDAERLGKLPPITYDDVLDAHQFFNDLNGDWHKHLTSLAR